MRSVIFCAKTINEGQGPLILKNMMIRASFVFYMVTLTLNNRTGGSSDI